MSRAQGSRLLLHHHVSAGVVLHVGKQTPPALGRDGSEVQEAALGLQLLQQHCWLQADKSQQIFLLISRPRTSDTSKCSSHQR